MVQQKVEIPHPPSIEERRRAIGKALGEAGEATHFVPSEAGYAELPVVTLASRWLIYRADNGRILSELADQAEARGTSISEVKERSETDAVQHLLHDLLVTKAQDPTAPIYNELARYGHQTEPLVIGRDGLVLNGNRRLAAMRELAAQYPESCASFTDVRVAVLPEDIGQEDLEYIEAALQMAPELKLDYSWINRRLKLREHAHDLGTERVVAAYRFSGPEEIDTELAELALAEEYLEWIGEPGHYRAVTEQELLFTALRQQLAAIGAAHIAALWKLIGFTMIHAGPQLEARIDHYYPFTEPVPPAQRHWVLRSLAEDRGLVAHQPPGQNQPVDKHLAARLRPLIDKPADADSTARAVIALIDTLKGNAQRLLGTHRVMHHLQGARKVLEELDIDDMSEADVRRVRAEVAALELHVRAFESGDPDERPMPIRARLRLTWPVRIARRALRRLLRA